MRSQSAPLRYFPTFFYELPPALSPLGELLGVSLLNTRPLMDAVHQLVTETVAIIYPFDRFLVVADLRTSDGGSQLR